MTNTHQCGIAIGPILAVVAILAVLASAIAAGSGAFIGDTSAIKAKAQATAILEYANEVKLGVDRVIAKGCTDTQISFESPMVSGYYVNPNAPADKSCHVFDVNGGGIVWKKPLKYNSCLNNDFQFMHSSTGEYIYNIGTDNKDDLYLKYYIGFDSDGCRKICQAINDILGIAYIPNYDGYFSNAEFTGTYNDMGAGVNPVLPGGFKVCHSIWGSGAYTFLSVLIPR